MEVEARRHLDEHDRELLAQHVHLGREGVELRVNVDQPPLVRDRLRQLHGEAEARSHAPGAPPPRRATMGAVKRRVDLRGRQPCRVPSEVPARHVREQMVVCGADCPGRATDVNALPPGAATPRPRRRRRSSARRRRHGAFLLRSREKFVPVAGDRGRAGEVRLNHLHEPCFARGDAVPVEEALQVRQQEPAVGGEAPDPAIQRVQSPPELERSEARQPQLTPPHVVVAVGRVVHGVDDHARAERLDTVDDLLQPAQDAARHRPGKEVVAARR